MKMFIKLILLIKKNKQTKTKRKKTKCNANHRAKNSRHCFRSSIYSIKCRFIEASNNTSCVSTKQDNNNKAIHCQNCVGKSNLSRTNQ